MMSLREVRWVNVIVCSFLIGVIALPVFAQSPIYLDCAKPIEERIEDLMQRMTIEEKIALIHAQSKFSSPGVPRLGVPELWCTDGPHGIRPEVKWDEWNQAGWTNDSIVAFPALTCLAASWSREMAYLYGLSIGEEARYRKKDVLLGPGVNMFRTPLGGRNFEYMGEDPFLAGKMSADYVRGVQRNGVATCVKHYCLNNQEKNRHGVDVHVSDRALYEIYLPAFKMAMMEGGSWSVMGGYNLVDGEHACHNKRLLKTILRDEWGWDGVVVSDWGGTHSTDQAVANGLDLEFGTYTNGLSDKATKSYDMYYLALPFLEGIRNGKYSVASLDEKVRNVLRLHMRTTLNVERPFGCILSKEHYDVAQQVGEEGIVLLKNDRKILPLKLDNHPRILVVGENAIKKMTVGGGSSSLKVQLEESPLYGLQKRLNGVADVKWVRGYVGDSGGEYNGVSTGQDLKDTRPFKQLVDEAVEAAREADYVIYIGGLNKSGYQDCEGVDRKQYGLPYKQDSLIQALAKTNRNFVVVNISGNPVAMPWVKDVPAIVQSWYLGSKAGTSLASVLTGDVSPSGKLPFTWYEQLEDVPAHKLDAYSDKHEYYKEDIFLGYRWVDAHNDSKPLFPFGYGLSYTTFDYTQPVVSSKTITASDSITISLKVKNAGKVAAKEVVQLYISDIQSTLPRPVKELKGFHKVCLDAGEQREISFTLGKDAMSYFDDKKHAWVAEPGRFDALVGSSSQDIRGRVSFELK